MNPIERLRAVARSSGAPEGEVISQAAASLAAFAADPKGLVIACRRMAQHHPGSGAVVFLAARALRALDPVSEIWEAAGEMAADRTSDVVGGLLSPGESVLIVDWPTETASALMRRGDIEIRCVDINGTGRALGERLAERGADVVVIPPEQMGTAAATADHVLVEVNSTSRTGSLVPQGGLAAASTGCANGAVVTMVVPRGRAMTSRMWRAMAERAVPKVAPWQAPYEALTPYMFDQVATYTGIHIHHSDEPEPDCPDAPELFDGL